MKKSVLCTVFVVALLVSGGALAADVAAGKAKAAGCAGCHGLNGTSNNPMYPNLAGQKDMYLVKAMKDYRDGKRKDPMMEGMAKGLTDDEIANLAAFYASQKP
jgi:cytochrome c553